MSEKYLPIKIFEKRKDYDDRSTEGGGDNREPGFVLHGDKLWEHVEILSNDLHDVRYGFHEALSKQRTLPVIMATRLNESALAKSHRGRVVNILESDGSDNVIGVYGDRQILSVLSSEAVLDNLESTIQKEEAATLTSSLDGIEIFQPLTADYEEGHKEYRVRLFDYNDFDRNGLARILFEKYCHSINLPIRKKIRFTADMIIYRVEVNSLEQYKQLTAFEGLYGVEKTSLLDATLDALSGDELVPVKYPDEDEEYLTVGVLDTGISPIGHLSPWLEEDEFTSYPEEYANRGHGTAVASIIEYSDELNGTNIGSTHGVKLFSALVYPGQSIYPEDLVDNIREAVERNPQIKIWNMSLGEGEQSDLDSFSEFGMALDNIQDENNVLIIKSAGNCRNFEQGLPKQRISKSADSIRALTVGSIAPRQEEYDYAAPNTPSPFTRIGPGPASIIKPDLVFYGGNAGMHDGKRVEHGVRTFDLNDEDVRYAGTSFSTPAVTRIVSDLAYMLQEEFDPLLLRALTIHYAKYPADIKMKMAEKVNQMGFGVPVKAQDILYNSPDEITLILRDSLDKGSFIEMFNFPYPTSMVDENGFFRGQIILTLVNKSLVDEKVGHIDSISQIVLSKDHILDRVRPKELQERLPQSVEIFHLKSQQNLYVAFVFPLQIEDRIDVTLELGREHLDPTHKTVRVYLRRVVGEAEDFEAGLDGIFHVFSLCAVGVPAAPCMGVIICDHPIVSPFMLVRSDSGSFSFSGILCIERFDIVVPDLIEPVKFLVHIENECEEQ